MGWDASMILKRWRDRAPALGPAEGNSGAPGMPVDDRCAAMDAVNLALARQELVAAANASNPLTRAIIHGLASSLAGREPSARGLGGRPQRTDRDRS